MGCERNRKRYSKLPSAFMNDAKYIGLDVHQATISVAVLDSAGKLVMEAILEKKAETILQFMRGLRGSFARNLW
jgi:hypothetical protein